MPTVIRRTVKIVAGFYLGPQRIDRRIDTTTGKCLFRPHRAKRRIVHAEDGDTGDVLLDNGGHARNREIPAALGKLLETPAGSGR